MAGPQRTIDEDRMNTDPMKMRPGVTPLMSLDMAKPPTKEIDYFEFPRVVYKHPKEPHMKVEHRNNMHEVVRTELVPTEHITRLVQDKHELKKAQEDGWVKESYVPQAPPSSNEALY